MQEKIHGIVLSVVRHSDTKNIITLYTRERGRMSFLSPTGNRKASRMRNASLQLLSVIEADVRIVGSRDLQLLGKFSNSTVWRDLYFNPVKISIVIFLSEFLNSLLRESAPDGNLYEFIVRSLQLLDLSKGKYSNYHIAFLISLLPLVGIEPDMTGYGVGGFFDMREGVFRNFPPTHSDYLDPQQSGVIPLLNRMTLANHSRFRFNVGDRREILKGLLNYYSIHFPGTDKLKSPAILSDLFS